MPKRPTRQSADNNQEEQKKQKSSALKSEVWAEIRSFFLSDRVLFVTGLALAGFTLYALVSYISYFVNGAQDFSLLHSELSRREIREAVLNNGGMLGARMQDFFVDRVFGVSVIAIIVMMSIYSFQLMRYRRLRTWKPFFHSVFWLLWGSLAAAFLQDMTGWQIFFRLGGAHGEVINNILLSSIQWIGTLIVLIVVLTAYFITINPNTLPTLETWAKRVKHLFRRRSPQEQKVEEEMSKESNTEEPDFELLQDEEQPAGATLTFSEFESNTKPDSKKDANNEVPFTIEGNEESPQPTEETTDEEEKEQQATDTAEGENNSEEAQPADADLEISKPVEEETIDENDPDAWLKKLGPYDPRAELENYKFPSLDLLKTYDNENAPVINQDEQRENANRIVTTLRNYGVEIDSIKATVGPTVTLYEVIPKAGVRISKIQSLENDIMLSLSAVGIRIIAPMPGKGTVGIEVPNVKAQVVSMHSVIASKRFQEEQKMRLPIAYGRTITNEIFMFDLAKTPHLLVAGATGTGKSVAINAIITSLLYKKHPAELKLVMVDPKMVEFAPYKPLIRHFLAAQPDTDPDQIVITDCDKVINTLNSLVIEMENRYKLLMDAGVRNLEDYNEKFINRRLNPNKVVADSLHHQYLPYIVIIIDEYGDFIMQAGKQVETPIARITQKARAVGMHMILATQRPSVNIVTGVIKANIPTRIALRTQSVIDSRTVLDAKGAEQLIGRGDSLYAGNASVTRIQCAFVDTPEVDAIVNHIEHQQRYFGPYELPEYVGTEGEGEALAPGSVDLKKLDPMFRDVATYVVSKQEGSTSKLQRAFEIGYNRAGKLSDQLEATGIVGPNKGPKGRDVLIQDEASLKEVFERLGI